MAVDIVNLAKSNELNLLQEYKALNADPVNSEVFGDFHRFLSNSLKVSVNSEHQNLLKIIRGKAYLSSFELTGDYAEAIKHYGGRKEYRIIIDEYFENGKLFKYFALNSGNMGVPLWGSYCLVFELAYFKADSSVILKRNSLEKNDKGDFYYFVDKKLNESLFVSDLASLPNSKEICIIKKREEIPLTKRQDWSELICKCNNVHQHNDTNYIELLSHQKCTLDKNFAVRMKRNRVSKFYKSLEKVKQGKKVKGWNIMKKEFIEINTLQQEFNLRLEFI